MNNNIESKKSISNQIESLLKPLGVFALASYIVGLLVTNIYLANYGFFLFQLFKADYIITGSFWFILFLLAFIWLGVIRSQIEENKDNWKAVVMHILIGLLGYIFLMMLFSVTGVSDTSGLSDKSLVYSCAIFIAPAIVVHILIFGFEKYNQSPSNSGLYAFFFICMFVIILIIPQYLLRYATDIYPLYPKIWGGGRATLAKLIFEKKYLDKIKLTGIEINSQGVSKPIKILYETPEAYFVLPLNKKNGIKLDSKMVLSVSYQTK